MPYPQGHSQPENWTWCAAPLAWLRASLPQLPSLALRGSTPRVWPNLASPEQAFCLATLVCNSASQALKDITYFRLPGPTPTHPILPHKEIECGVPHTASLCSYVERVAWQSEAPPPHPNSLLSFSFSARSAFLLEITYSIFRPLGVQTVPFQIFKLFSPNFLSSLVTMFGACLASK